MPEPITFIGVVGGIVALVTGLAQRYFHAAKEIMDIVLGLLFLLMSVPILLVCGLMVKFTSAGPVFFSQVRVGRNGKLFRMYKLRTMWTDAEAQTGAVWAADNDPRVIPACRWMRRSHMDELPQLLNVIRGEMSLVGPRPERPEILEELEKTYPDIRKRLVVKPGITGLAQVRHGYDKGADTFRHKLATDLEYISNSKWSIEFAILARTVTKLNDKQSR